MSLIVWAKTIRGDSGFELMPGQVALDEYKFDRCWGTAVRIPGRHVKNGSVSAIWNGAAWVDWGTDEFLQLLLNHSKAKDIPAASIEATAPKSRGLGDTIAKVTTAVGIKPCDGCKKRAEFLNKLVPYSTAT